MYACEYERRAYLGGVPHHHLIVTVGRIIFQGIQKVQVLRRGADLLLKGFDPLCQLLHIVNGVPKNGCPVHLMTSRGHIYDRSVLVVATHNLTYMHNETLARN